MSRPRGTEVTVLGAVALPGVRREARRVRIEWPSGTTAERIQLAGADGFEEVEG